MKNIILTTPDEEWGMAVVRAGTKVEPWVQADTAFVQNVVIKSRIKPA